MHTPISPGIACQPPALIRLLDRHPNTIQRSDYSTDIRLLNRNPNTQQKPDYNAKIQCIRQKSNILIQKSDYSTGILFSYTVPLKGVYIFWEKKSPCGNADTGYGVSIYQIFLIYINEKTKIFTKGVVGIPYNFPFRKPLKTGLEIKLLHFEGSPPWVRVMW